MHFTKFVTLAFSTVLTFALLGAPASVHAEDKAAEYSLVSMQPLELVDSPVAGMLEKGSFGIGLRFTPGGSLLSIIRVGLLDSWQFGFSIRVGGLIAAGTPTWGRGPEFNTRFRIIEESESAPAVVLGFNSQGYGEYHKEIQRVEGDTIGTITIARYERKSRGFYCAVSKNLGVLAGLGVHGGINYSLETSDGDNGSLVSGFMGVDLLLSDAFSICADYDLALNDRTREYEIDSAEDFFPGKGRGFLDLGMNWFFTENLCLAFYMRDVLQNTENPYQIPRELRIVYRESF